MAIGQASAGRLPFMNPPAFAIIGTITWLAIFEYNYHPRIYRYKEDVTILQAGDGELDFNHPPGASSPTTSTTLCERQTSTRLWWGSLP